MTYSEHVNEINGLIVTFLHAAAARISKNIRMIYLSYEDEKFVFCFVLELDSASDRDEIDDYACETEAMSGNSKIETRIIVSSAPRVRPDIQYQRLIYWRAEPAE